MWTESISLPEFRCLGFHLLIWHFMITMTSALTWAAGGLQVKHPVVMFYRYASEVVVRNLFVFSVSAPVCPFCVCVCVCRYRAHLSGQGPGQLVGRPGAAASHPAPVPFGVSTQGGLQPGSVSTPPRAHAKVSGHLSTPKQEVLFGVDPLLK